MTAHLGPRVSALLDGQLARDDAESAWQHVYSCHACRDLVEREGWIKTRLAGLSSPGVDSASDRLKGALAGLTGPSSAPPGPMGAGGDRGESSSRSRPARTAGLAALGGGAVGAAVMGILALGAAPADTPVITGFTPTPVTQTFAPNPVPSAPGPGPVAISARGRH